MTPLQWLRAQSSGLLKVCGWLALAGLALLRPAWADVAPAQQVTLVYPRPESEHDSRDHYVLELLRLALSKPSGRHYQLQAAAVTMPQLRALRELELGHGLNITWSMTSAAREATLLPIRIPIDKGLLGLRLALLPADRPEALADVRQLQDLQALVAGQGQDWPDAQILRSSGLPVNGVGNYEALFRMLALHRFDYFPRSVLEAWQELDQHAELGLVLDRHLLIHYPTALYFFVRREDQALAEALRQGLEQALQDGSFDCLFDHHFGPLLQKAGLASRTVIELPNPLLPAATPLARSELWYHPNQAPKTRPLPCAPAQSR